VRRADNLTKLPQPPGALTARPRLQWDSFTLPFAIRNT